MSETSCIDHNGTKLCVGDNAMAIINGEENEGTVIKLLSGNKCEFDGESGKIVADCNDLYILP